MNYRKKSPGSLEKKTVADKQNPIRLSLDFFQEKPHKLEESRIKYSIIEREKLPAKNSNILQSYPSDMKE